MRKIYFFTLMSLLFSILEVHSQWMKTGVGEEIVSADFGDINTVYAVGSNKLFLKSTNQGTSWTQMKVSFGNMYSEVQAPTLNDVYIIEPNYGSILKSSNGGVDWTEKYVGNNLKALFFLNKDTGFVTSNTYDYDSSKYNNIIYRTYNGGNSWEATSLGFTFMPQTIFKIFVVPGPSPKLCAVGSDEKVYFSMNKGMTWTQNTAAFQGQSYTYRSGFFTSEMTGFLIAENGYLLRTMNGGSNWTPEPVDGGMAWNLTDIYVKPNNDIVITGGMGNIYYYNAMNLNWNDSDTLKAEPNILALAVKPSLPDVMLAFGQKGTIVRSTDGGSNWTLQNYVPFDISAICFADANNGFAGTSMGEIMKTIDGGNSWNLVSSIPMTSINGLSYSSGKLYAATFNALYRSDDNGATWIVEVPGIPSKEVYVNGTNGAVTVDFNFAKYFNGTVWTDNNSFTTLSDISFVNTTTGFGYIGNATDTLYKTIDGGINWTSVKGGLMNVYDIFFVDANIGYLCSFNGLVAKTIDGGVNWDTLDTKTSSTLNKIYFTTSQIGYVVGQGIILKTIDGGLNWTKDLDGGFDFYNAIISNGTTWFAGNNTNGLHRLLNTGMAIDSLTIGTDKNSEVNFSHSLAGAWEIKANKNYLTVTPPSGTGPAANVKVVTTQKLLADTAKLFVNINQMVTLGSISSYQLVKQISLLHNYFKVTGNDMFYPIDTLFFEAKVDEHMMINKSINVSSSADIISVTSDVPWLTIPSAPTFYFDSWSKIYDGEVYFDIQDNTTAISREGFINFNTTKGIQKLKVIQNGLQPMLILSKVDYKLPQAAVVPQKLYISSNAPWTLSSSYPWLVLSKTSGLGIDSITISASDNTGASQRVASFSVNILGLTPQAVIVIQDGTGATGGVTCSHEAKILNTNLPVMCEGETLELIANTGTGFIYQWFADGIMVQGGTTNKYVVTKAGSYAVAVTTNNCTLTSAAISVVYHPSVSIPVIVKKSGNIAPCSGGSIVLETTTPYASYLWSTDETSSTISVTKSGKFSVSVSDANGCKASSTQFEINASEAATPSICVVTVDRIEKQNVIVWKRATGQKIKSYVIYKETAAAGDYEVLDTVPYQDYNFIVDPNSNPALRSYRYKVSAIDECNVESPVSEIHKTLHLTLNSRYGGGVNLIWDGYEGLDIKTYHIYHGDSPTDMSFLIDVPSNLFSYTITDNLKRYYAIAIVLEESCELNSVIKAEAGPYSQSLSNIAEFKTISNDLQSISGISAYPNPFGSSLNIEYTLSNASDVRIEFVNSLGQIVSAKQFAAQESGYHLNVLNTESMNLVSGLYTIRIIIGEEVKTIKAVCK